LSCFLAICTEATSPGPEQRYRVTKRRRVTMNAVGTASGGAYLRPQDGEEQDGEHAEHLETARRLAAAAGAT